MMQRPKRKYDLALTRWRAIVVERRAITERAEQYATDAWALVARLTDQLCLLQELVREMRRPLRRAYLCKEYGEAGAIRAKLAVWRRDHAKVLRTLAVAERLFYAARNVYNNRKAALNDALTRLQVLENAVDFAKIPPWYWGHVKIVPDPDGDIHIYFGGDGSPDGDGHGHCVLNRSGDLLFRRDPVFS